MNKCISIHFEHLIYDRPEGIHGSLAVRQRINLIPLYHYIIQTRNRDSHPNKIIFLLRNVNQYDIFLRRLGVFFLGALKLPRTAVLEALSEAQTYETDAHHTKEYCQQFTSDLMAVHRGLGAFSFAIIGMRNRRRKAPRATTAQIFHETYE